jgi:hypothetical protein
MQSRVRFLLYNRPRVQHLCSGHQRLYNSGILHGDITPTRIVIQAEAAKGNRGVLVNLQSAIETALPSALPAGSFVSMRVTHSCFWLISMLRRAPEHFTPANPLATTIAQAPILTSTISSPSTMCCVTWSLAIRPLGLANHGRRQIPFQRGSPPTEGYGTKWQPSPGLTTVILFTPLSKTQ